MYRLPRAFRLRQAFPLPRQHTTTRQFRSLRPLRQPQRMWRPSGEAVNVEKVRFKSPGWNRKRLMNIALYIAIPYGILRFWFWHLGLEVSISFEDEEEEETHDQRHEQEAQNDNGAVEEMDEDEMYAEVDSTFIPMTWPKKCERTYYKGTDPEWQEFVKVAKDKARHQRIQNELVQIVYTGTMKYPAIARQLGKDAKVGKYWLDITFPDGPPPEFERSGIEIGEGFVAWSSQRIPAESQWRLTRALWPTAAADSLWASSRVLIGIQWRKLKQALGMEQRNPLSPEERYRRAIEMLSKHQQGRQQKDVGGAPDAVTGSSALPPSTQQASASRNSPSQDSDGKGKFPWSLSVPMPSISPFSSSGDGSENDNAPPSGLAADLPVALHVFSATLSKQWDPKNAEPPRGTFVVQGLVEVRGARGRVLFDVQSCYDPRAAKYVTVNAGVRNFKRWNQAPKGGP